MNREQAERALEIIRRNRDDSRRPGGPELRTDLDRAHLHQPRGARVARAGDREPRTRDRLVSRTTGDRGRDGPGAGARVDTAATREVQDAVSRHRIYGA